MSLHDKLRGLPHIYYINLEDREDRKKFMESQFETWGIEKYTRVNASKFLKDDPKTWAHLVHLPKIIPINRWKSLCVSLSHMETIRTWLEETSEEYMIIMEDDTDISLIKYWHFDWEYLMNNLPYDWDAVQLMYNSDVRIYCFLHPKKLITWNGPLLIKRSYAEKLLSLYYIKGKYNFIKKVNRVVKSNCIEVGRVYTQSTNKWNTDGSGSRITVLDVDEFLGHNGKVYQIPVFTQDPSLEDPPKLHHIFSNKIHLYWWTVMKDRFTLEDFFTYGKPYDSKMILNLDMPWYNEKNKNLNEYQLNIVTKRLLNQ
jgi:hypothetical protein